MNKDIMKQAGFEEEVKLVEESICPFCKKKIQFLADIIPPFRDTLSLKEYRISGLCQKCQDEMFGA